MIKVYVNESFVYTANYCKNCEEAINELKLNKCMSVYCGGSHHVIKVSDTDIITAKKF